MERENYRNVYHNFFSNRESTRGYGNTYGIQNQHVFRASLKASSGEKKKVKLCRDTFILFYFDIRKMWARVCFVKKPGMYIQQYRLKDQRRLQQCVFHAENVIGR